MALNGHAFLPGRPVLLAFMLCLAVLSGCDTLPFGAVSVKEVVNNPTQYDGKQVKVRGVASNVTKIPLVGINSYTLTDEGSQILVVGGDTIPAANREVVVLAEVRSLAIVGSESLGLHLKEIRRFDKLLF